MGEQRDQGKVQLCNAQQRALTGLLESLGKTNLLALWSAAGMGRTTVLREFHRRSGGTFLGMAEFLEHAARRHPLAPEDALYEMVREALAGSDLVILDDLHLLAGVVAGGCHMYPRNGYLDMPLTALASSAQGAGKRLVIGMTGQTAEPVNVRCFFVGIEEFSAADYDDLCATFLGPQAAARLNFQKIHRFAPKLSAHQLRQACSWFHGRDDLETDTFIEYLRSQRMASNVDLGEVQAVDLHDLKGIDDVLDALEANIIVPLENDALAQELGIRPKRGVLLAGPPGTGKTTVGRALAHRLKSKFFLIDGTFISGTAAFYQRVHQVFEAAKQNAPAVVFIDDSDVIFENGEEAGLYRYLLTMLDGLESQTAGRVCVMMTAMNVGALPPALVRSGRIELWLETRLPDEIGREAILRDFSRDLPDALRGYDLGALLPATEGMTGADLKRLTEDAKLLFAFDVARKQATKPATEYFLAAAQTVRANKEKYAEAEAAARAQRPSRPPWYNVHFAMAEAAASVAQPPH